MYNNSYTRLERLGGRNIWSKRAGSIIGVVFSLICFAIAIYASRFFCKWRYWVYVIFVPITIVTRTGGILAHNDRRGPIWGKVVLIHCKG
jgi:low affinity Fe/Cu permease